MLPVGVTTDRDLQTHRTPGSTGERKRAGKRKLQFVLPVYILLRF